MAAPLTLRGLVRLVELLRRLSWQRLLVALAEAPELAYLVKGVEEKYGLRPE